MTARSSQQWHSPCLHNHSEFAFRVSLSLFVCIVICHVQLYTKCTFSRGEEKLPWPRQKVGWCTRYSHFLACPIPRKKYPFSQTANSLLHDSLWSLHLPPFEQRLEFSHILYVLCCRFPFHPFEWKDL